MTYTKPKPDFMEVGEDPPSVQFPDELRSLEDALARAAFLRTEDAHVSVSALRKLLRHLREQDSRLSWFTTCKSCSSLWDKVYEYDMERQELRDALQDMTWQHAYHTNDGERLYTGGLSSNEHAFSVLGWDDPYTIPKEEASNA